MIDTAELPTAPTVVERVAAGAAWLDATRPGWSDLIDLDRLELTSSNCCVLGQVFESYHLAPGAGSAGFRAWSSDHGFTVSVGSAGARYWATDWAGLQDAWTSLIRGRR